MLRMSICCRLLTFLFDFRNTDIQLSFLVGSKCKFCSWVIYGCKRADHFGSSKRGALALRRYLFRLISRQLSEFYAVVQFTVDRRVLVEDVVLRPEIIAHPHDNPEQYDFALDTDG